MKFGEESSSEAVGLWKNAMDGRRLKDFHSAAFSTLDFHFLCNIHTSYLVWELCRRCGRRDHVQGRRVQRLLGENKSVPDILSFCLILPGAVMATLAGCSVAGRNEKEEHPIGPGSGR